MTACCLPQQVQGSRQPEKQDRHTTLGNFAAHALRAQSLRKQVGFVAASITQDTKQHAADVGNQSVSVADTLFRSMQATLRQNVMCAANCIADTASSVQHTLMSATAAQISTTFVGVFDGHGGTSTAQHAATRLHTILSLDHNLWSTLGEQGGVLLCHIRYNCFSAW